MSSLYTSLFPKQKLCELQETIVADDKYLLPTRYVIEKIIGKGSYGAVCQGKDTVTGDQIAIKKNKDVFPPTAPGMGRRTIHSRRAAISDEGIKGAQGSPAKPQDLLRPIRLLREIKILAHLDQHPNIVQLKDVILPESFDKFQDIYLVTDLMPADLRDFLETKQALTDEHVKYMIYQLLMALSYTHSANIIHRDVKPENILLDSTCEIKLCDFGLARGITEEDPTMSTAYVQTRWYRAPELLLNHPTVTKSIDVWSAGCVMAELLLGHVFLPGKSPAHQLELILKMLGTPKDLDNSKGSPQGVEYLKRLKRYEGEDWDVRFKGVNPHAIDLMQKMLQFDPDDRVSATDAMRHPYFTGLFFEEDIFKCEKLFDFAYEDGMLDIQSVKEEAWKTVLEYNGILNRRRSSILEVEDGHGHMLVRRPSKIKDDIQNDLMKIQKGVINSKLDNSREPSGNSPRNLDRFSPRSPRSPQEVMNSEDLSSPRKNTLFDKMKSFLTRK